MDPVEHVPGPYDGGIQSCTRCGSVLADYRNVAYRIEDGPPRAWPEDRLVVREGRMTYTRALAESVLAEMCRPRPPGFS